MLGSKNTCAEHPVAGSRARSRDVMPRPVAGHTLPECQPATAADARYGRTGPTLIHTGPACGHAPNGIGTTLEAVWSGG